MVRYALAKLGLEGSVFSYGDNVIAPLKIPEKILTKGFDNNYDKLLLTIKSNLESIFDKFGIV